MGTEVIEVRIDGGEGDEVLEVLEEGRHRFERSGETFYIYCTNGAKELYASLDRLLRLRPEPEGRRMPRPSLLLRPATLEDLFLKLAGRSLRE